MAVDPVVTLALLVAVLVVVPLGSRLLDGRVRRRVIGAGMAGAAVSLVVLPAGVDAAAAASMWLLTAVVLKAAELRAWWRDPHLGWCALGRLAATGYLVGGAGWLVVTRAGWQPFGLHEPYIALTAVHFHFAGFGASLLLALLAERTRVPAPAALAVIGGPAIVAAGFALRPELQLVGAAVMAAGLTAVALLSWRTGNALVKASSLCVLAGMALAVHWAGAVVTNRWTAIDIDVMARVHGTLNGFGFVLLGVVGRVTATTESRAASPSAR